MHRKEDMIELKPPYTFYWKLEWNDRKPEEYQKSKTFYLQEYAGCFGLFISRVFPHPETLYLYSYEIDGCKTSENMTLNFVFRYSDFKTEYITLKNIKGTDYRTSTEYMLRRDFKIKNLLEIICMFTVVPIASKAAKVAGTIKSGEKVTENYEVTKHEGELILTGHSKTMKGELVLADDLKNIFLDEEESDIILKVGDQSFPAHKIIIRARSPVFYAMLKHDMKEKEESAVNIEDCDPDIFREFLYYLYSGKLDNLTESIVFELYHIADKYDVKELRIVCLGFIQSHLNVDMICDTVSLALKHCEDDLLTQATKFFIDNVHDIITTVNWQKFLKENPIAANELFIKTLNQKIPKKEN